MATSWRTVRVFISSTFRDMHAERDHLVTVVFPELRERIERLGLDFFDVDLRWGVPAKDANGETANSWEYCRQWIDRVEPFFVCILGQRYGYRPEPRELRDPAEQARQQAQQRSITELEVRHAVLNERRKRRSCFYLRDTPVPVPPPDATAEERATYDEFVDPPEQLAQLDALKADIRGCGRPVRGYPCRWTGQGFADLERFGRLVLDDLWSGLLRDERYVSKEVWRQVLGADSDADPRYTDESRPVPRGLWEQIVALARPAPVLPLGAERQQMDAFAASRLRWFQGRTRELQQLTDFLHANAAGAPRLAVVAALPGQGKSALLAHLHEQLKSSPRFVITHFVGATERSATPHALVERLLGELDRSGIAWPAEQQGEGQEPKRDFNSLCLRLAQRLGDYAGERRIVILLDALNQLSEGHDLHWLPTRLGPSVRVIASCVEDAAAKADGPEQCVLHALASRQPAPLRVPLGPLTEADVRTIVVAYLKDYCHELDREHLDTLCAITQARNPLYLLVMLNELRTLGGNDMNRIVPARIASMPQDHPDTVSLFRWVLQRLEVFGPEAVRWWCLYLAHGRVGMASHELTDLLARKLGTEAAATALRIERGLRRYLQPRGELLDFFHNQLREAIVSQYLTDDQQSVDAHRALADYFGLRADPGRSGTFADADRRSLSELPFHQTHARDWSGLEGTLADALFVEAKCTAGLTYDLVADYVRLGVGGLPTGPLIVTGLRCLRAGEIPRWGVFCPRCHANRQIEQESLGRDIACPSCAAPLHVNPFALDADWEEQVGASYVFQCGTAYPQLSQAVSEWAEVVLREAHVLALRPQLALPVIANSVARKTAPLESARRALDVIKPRPWLRWTNPPGASPCVMTISTPAAVSRYSPDGSRILTVSNGNTVKLWRSSTGEELADIDAGSSKVVEAEFSGDGTRIVLSSEDRGISVREEQTGHELTAITPGGAFRFQGFSLSPCGKLLVSFSAHNVLSSWTPASVLTLWTVESLAELWTLSLGERYVACAFSHDSRRIACLTDRDKSGCSPPRTDGPWANTRWLQCRSRRRWHFCPMGPVSLPARATTALSGPSMWKPTRNWP